jgi:4-hydroxy-3-methylbut-2-enyl diphosphate reductase
MKIIVAKTAGFCFGVKRAIDIAFQIARGKREGVYTLGPIIHNPQVIERLKEEGIIPIDIFYGLRNNRCNLSICKKGSVLC